MHRHKACSLGHDVVHAGNLKEMSQLQEQQTGLAHAVMVSYAVSGSKSVSSDAQTSLRVWLGRGTGWSLCVPLARLTSEVHFPPLPFITIPSFVVQVAMLISVNVEVHYGAILLHRCSLFKPLVLVLMLQKRQRGGMVKPQEEFSASLVQLMQRLDLSTSSSGHHCVSTTASHVAYFGVFTLGTKQKLLVCFAAYACSLAQIFSAA